MKDANLIEQVVNVRQSGLNMRQRVAICFAAGVVGGAAVVLFSQILFGSGLSAAFGVGAPLPLTAPEVYRPLLWGGLWGIPFGFVIKKAWTRLYLVGFLYYLVPMLALYLYFLPLRGAGYFGASHGPMFAVYLLVMNLPFGIVTALAARAMIGKQP